MSEGEREVWAQGEEERRKNKGVLSLSPLWQETGMFMEI